MRKVEEFQRFAQEWREKARTTRTEEVRAMCEKIAEDYERQAKERLRLIIAQSKTG